MPPVKRFSIASLEKMASHRSAEYLEDVLSRSTVTAGTVEISDEAYNELVAKYRKSAPPAPTSGPGTELKKLLKLVGITATPNCSCNARAREMDARGSDWCEANLDTIVGWLREEATKRKLPFVDMAGRMLVKRAIRNARRAAS